MRLEVIEPDQMTSGVLLQFEASYSNGHKHVLCSVLASTNGKLELHRQKAMASHEDRSNCEVQGSSD
jgi:hypothetical protein